MNLRSRRRVSTSGSGTTATEIAGGVIPADTFNTFEGGDLGYDYEFDVDSSSLPSGWSWVNQGGASYLERYGAGRITFPATGSTMRGIVRTLPVEATWSAYLWASAAVGSRLAGDTEFYGLWLRDSASGKNAMIRRASTSGIITTRYNDTSFTGGANYSSAVDSASTGVVAFKVTRNSATSYSFYFSADGGISWASIDLARDMTAHFTPDQIGFVCANNVATSDDFSIHAFRVR